MRSNEVEDRAKVTRDRAWEEARGFAEFYQAVRLFHTKAIVTLNDGGLLVLATLVPHAPESVAVSPSCRTARSSFVRCRFGECSLEHLVSVIDSECDYTAEDGSRLRNRQPTSARGNFPSAKSHGQRPFQLRLEQALQLGLGDRLRTRNAGFVPGPGGRSCLCRCM